MILTLQPRIRGMVLDMDGVLWRGSQILGNPVEIFNCIQALGIQVVLATNNATQSIDQYIDRFNALGVTLNEQQVVNSGQAAAYLLRQQHPEGGPVYIVGEQGLVNALSAAGFFPSEDHPLAVVAGLDRGFTYHKLTLGADFIRGGAQFIGTNPDTTFPSPNGITPGAGSILAALETASGVKPTIAGKPQRAMYDLALQRMGLPPEETISIGDRLDTDIAGGQRLGLRTGLVLSGITTREQASSFQPAPDLIAENLTELLGLKNG